MRRVSPSRRDGEKGPAARAPADTAIWPACWLLLGLRRVAGRGGRLEEPDSGLDNVGRGPIAPGGGQAECLLVVLNRLVDLPTLGQGVSQVVVGLQVVGLDFQGLAVMGNSLVHLSAAAQDVAEIGVGVDVVRLKL